MAGRNVLVEVPVEDLEAVISLLDHRAIGAQAAQTSQAETSGSSRNSNGGGVVWSPQEYESLMAATQISYQRVRQFADALSDHAGDQLSMSQVAELSGLRPSEIRAALGKLTQWMNANFAHANWPFGWASNTTPDNPYEFYYKMSIQQAQAWRTARN